MKLGNSRCQCLGCDEYFNSVHAFDLHRRGKPDNRRCLPPEVMIRGGMVKNTAEFWVSEPNHKAFK